MRVLLVTANLTCGGAERVLTWIASELRDRGHQVRLLTWSGSETDFYPVPLGVKRVSANYAAPESKMVGLEHLRFLLLIRRCAREADVVLSFLTIVNLATLLATLGSSTPIVVSERNALMPDRNRLRETWLPRFLVPRRASALVVQSESLASAFRTAWKMTDIHVIPNAHLPEVSASASVRRTPTVLAIGRLVAQKNHASLIRAWSLIAKAHPEWTLRIIGDGPLLDQLTHLTHRLGVHRSVEFRSATRDIASEYARASVFVLPSLHEGFPNVLLEAAGSGLPCITTECPGAGPEILMRGASGHIVPVDDDEALASAVNRLITNVSDRERLGTAACEAAKRFNAKSIADAWEDLLRHIAARASRSH